MGVRALGGVFVLAIPVGSAVVGVGGVMGLGVGFASQPDPGEVVGPIDPAMDRRFWHCSPPKLTKLGLLWPPRGPEEPGEA